MTDATAAPAPVSAVTVFTGSAAGVDPRYAELTRELATDLAGRGVDVVYGGGHVGLMGVLADTALAAGGRVVGVMPRHLVDGEIAHPRLSELEVVADMHERKLRMAELGDAFVALPGGAGTLEEFFEVWTWQQLGLHPKPVVLYDAQFWAPLTALIDHMVAEGFLRQVYRDSLIVVDAPDELAAALERWEAPASKWG